MTAPGYQIGEAESLNISPLMRTFNVARVNVLLPAIEPPPPTPQIGVRLFRVVEGERVEIACGLVEADTPLVIGVPPVQGANQPALAIRGDGVKVQGQALSVVEDPLRQARPSDPMAVTYVAQDSSRADGLYVPANAGTYVVEVTAIKATAIKATVPPEPVAVRYAFRVVAASGGVETDPDQPPAVREAATSPATRRARRAGLGAAAARVHRAGASGRQQRRARGSRGRRRGSRARAGRWPERTHRRGVGAGLELVHLGGFQLVHSSARPAPDFEVWECSAASR